MEGGLARDETKKAKKIDRLYTINMKITTRVKLVLIIGLMSLLFMGCNLSWDGIGEIFRTSTPAPVCTPPVCAIGTNEVYFCREECPGGCGTTCATYTPVP